MHLPRPLFPVPFIALCLVACAGTRPDAVPQVDQGPQRGGTFQTIPNRPLANLHPWVTVGSNWQAYFTSGVYEQLVTRDTKPGEDWRQAPLSGRLAESWGHPA